MVPLLPSRERLTLKNHVNLLFEIVYVGDALKSVVGLLVLGSLISRKTGLLVTCPAVLAVDIHLKDLLLDRFAQLLVAHNHISSGGSNR